MVLAWYVREAAPAYTDWLASETNRSDERCATRPIPEKRPNRKATVSGGGNNSIEAGNSSSSTIQTPGTSRRTDRVAERLDRPVPVRVPAYRRDDRISPGLAPLAAPALPVAPRRSRISKYPIL